MGVDLLERLIAKVKILNSTLDFMVGDVYKLPYTDQSVDGVFSNM